MLGTRCLFCVRIFFGTLWIVLDWVWHFAVVFRGIKMCFSESFCCGVGRI